MAQNGFDPGEWVHSHKHAIKRVLNIFGVKAEKTREMLGANLSKEVTRSNLLTLPQDVHVQLPNLLAGMGLFNGRLAPESSRPRYTLVVAGGLRKLTNVLPSLLGQSFICLPSSRDWNEQEDGPRATIAAIAEWRARSKWCEWANSPEALWRRDTLEPSFSGPHDSLFGLTALAIVHASGGQYDLAYAVPHLPNDSKNGLPSRILLDGSQGSAIIYPCIGVGHGAEWDDLKHWVQVAREQQVYMGADQTLHIATHATSVLRMSMYAHEILAQEWPECRINIVAPRISPDDRPTWVRDALQELAFLIGRSG